MNALLHAEPVQLLGNRCCEVSYGQRAAGSGQRAAGSGQRAAGSGQRAAGCGQRAAGSGQRAAGSGRVVAFGIHWSLATYYFQTVVCRNVDTATQGYGDRLRPLSVHEPTANANSSRCGQDSDRNPQSKR